jgi:hypothetical protein
VGKERLHFVCVGTKGDLGISSKRTFLMIFKHFGAEIFFGNIPNLLIGPLPCQLSPSKAFHLNCGFNCNGKCHLCDATDWHCFGEDAAWRATVGVNRSTSPFWNMHIPLLSIPGMTSTTILPDSCHTFHLGWGVDLGASGLVLMCKRDVFPGRTLDDRLRNAYSMFMSWCAQNKKTSGIDWWSTKKLDMASKLDHTFGIFLDYICGSPKTKNRKHSSIKFCFAHLKK